ncbi:MAG: hypothetical protein B7X07_01485 [Actinobacteria bacterium 21-64-8]|nr:MAG: hypothetical protein B7X07_01485 [Actinobacteria bacterium 21-64-8]
MTFEADSTTPRSRSSRWLWGGAAIAALGVALVTVLSSSSATPVVAAVAPSTVPSSMVANATGGSVALFHSPTSLKAYAALSNPTAAGGPLVFLVATHATIAQRIEVYLPTRPNDSTAWIRASAVQLRTDPYTVDVSLSQHRLRVVVGTRVIFSALAGVGRPALPTPTGRFYLQELLRQPDPTGAYGPYAFGLSAHSTVLMSFDGGAGQIGLHGTNVASSVGASVSHGCVRVSDLTIAHLARLLPLGTPVVISR